MTSPSFNEKNPSEFRRFEHTILRLSISSLILAGFVFSTFLIVPWLSRYLSVRVFMALFPKLLIKLRLFFSIVNWKDAKVHLKVIANS